MFDGDIAALELAEHNGRPLKLEQKKKKRLLCGGSLTKKKKDHYVGKKLTLAAGFIPFVCTKYQLHFSLIRLVYDLD